MEDKFDGMYMNHLSNKHDEWAGENRSKRKSYKKGSSQITRDGERSTGNSESGKILTKYLHKRRYFGLLRNDYIISYQKIKVYRIETIGLGGFRWNHGVSGKFNPSNYCGIYCMVSSSSYGPASMTS